MKREDGKILKPIQPPPKGPREANFYVEINRSNHPIDVLIRNHIPKFHGLEQVGFTNGIVVTEDFLVLDDITEGFELPTVMDIKVGKQTWGPDATEAKKVGEASKYVGTKGPYGFRLVFNRENFTPSSGLSINYVSFFSDFDPPPINYISISYSLLKKYNKF